MYITYVVPIHNVLILTSQRDKRRNWRTTTEIYPWWEKCILLSYKLSKPTPCVFQPHFLSSFIDEGVTTFHLTVLRLVLQVRMKSMFAIGFCFTALMGMFNSMWVYRQWQMISVRSSGTGGYSVMMTNNSLCSLWVFLLSNCSQLKVSHSMHLPTHCLLISLSCFSFDGRVVAKLPFVPLSYIQGLSHRNLLGEDFTDCSFIFLYILCTMSIRQVTQLTLSYHLSWVAIYWQE